MRHSRLIAFWMGLTVMAFLGKSFLTSARAFDLDSQIPRGRLGVSIRRGQYLFMRTRHRLKPYVGNNLNCASCHIGGGIVPNGESLVGVYGLYPRYLARSGRVVTLKDRVNGCLTRSLNGRLAPQGSPEMAALLDYLAWISKGVSKGQKPKGYGAPKIKGAWIPNRGRGKNIYKMRCASCHGRNGEGTVDSDGVAAIPPLWGWRSFSIGAGMARLNTAAAFIKANMPQGRGGTLSNQESYDIADYVIHQPRPNFAQKLKDWPRGGKPKDARY